MIGIAFILSMWITLSWGTGTERLCGAGGCSLLMLAAFLLVRVWTRMGPANAGQLPRDLAVGLASTSTLEVGWSLIELDSDALWLQRNGLAFTLGVAALMLGRFVLPRLLRDTAWQGPVRSAAQSSAP